ncbi:hypothetical protein CSA37_04020 [Candidatus Fermentibacteria bacterium]|nr:MAG: hypothetical protein CSA37_10695 [Candidatus Fermentibacteria bacterium]PIE52819.1 MAG: hypothetical protein CSA37_04020 [Candidatus Fermentibacteria bacterium]
MTITEVGFKRAAFGSSSVTLYDFKLSLGYAGGVELGRNFHENAASETVLAPLFAGSTVTAADNGQGQVMFTLNEPFEYTGGNLLVDLSFSDISGSMYLWAWDSGEKRVVTADRISCENGNACSVPPVVVIKGD